jgi:hypothetical protein
VPVSIANTNIYERDHNFTIGVKINVASTGAGPAVTRGTIGKANTNIKIIWARGHLHSGGVKMVLYNNPKGRVENNVICTSLPKYDATGIITEMSLCPEMAVKEGDTLIVESYYDTRAHPL